MKPPSSNMGGGYRRKADQDTLGRNSRIRYSTYVPFDKRMTPASNARIYANTNKVRGTNIMSNIMSGDITSGVFEIISKTHNSTYNNDATEWELEFDWTVENAGSVPINYEMQLAIIDRSTHVLGNIGEVYTADASSQTDEASETVTVPTGGSGGNFNAYLQAVEDGTSKVLGRSDIFAITLIDATVTSSDVDFDMPAHRQTDVVVSSLVGNSTIDYTIVYRLEKYDGTTTYTYTAGGATDLLANLVGTQTNLWSAVNDLYHRRKVQIDLVYQGYTYTSAWSTNFCYPPTTNITTFATSLQDADIKFSDFKITVDSIAYTGTDTTWWIQVEAILPGDFATAIVAGSPTNLNSWVASKTSGFTVSAPYSPGQEITSIRRMMYPSNWMVGEVPLTAKAGFDVDNWTPTSGGLGPIYYPTVTATSFTLAAQSSPWIGFDCFFQSITGTHLPGTFDFGVTVYTVIAGSITTEPTQNVNMDPQSSPGTLAYAYARTTDGPVKYLIDSVITRLNGDIYHTNGVDGTPIFLPPSFMSWTMSATDITHDGYNIKLTAFSGFTEFVLSMTNSYEIELVIKDGGGTLHTETVTWTPSTDTLPHTLFSPNRTTHSSWFNGNAQTHAIDANLFYNFNHDGGPGLVASKSQTDIVTGVAIPPAVYGLTVDIANPSNFSYDIRLTSFTGFTAFTGSSNNEYTFDIIFKNGATTVHTETVNWDPSANPVSISSPHVLYTTDRAFTDASWWTHNSSGTHTIDILLKYEYNDPASGFSNTYNLFSLLNADTWGYSVFTYLDGYFYNQAYFAIMIRTDAQNSQSYSMLNATEVNYVRDVSGNVQGNSGQSRLARKGQTYSSPTIPRMTRTTTINGHDSFDGWCTWGFVTSVTYIGNTDNGDVPKSNNDESYTMVQVFQISNYTGAWSPLSVYYLANGNRGVVTTRWGTTSTTNSLIGNQLKSADFFNLPSNTPMILVTRYESLSGGTGENYNLYIDAMRINDGTIIHSTMLNDTDTIISFFNDAVAGAYFIGCNEFGAGTSYDQFPTVGVNPDGYIWGENILYNKFLSNQQTSQLMTELRNKWM